MRLLWVLLCHEARIHARSLRSRVVAIAFVVITLVPAANLAFRLRSLPRPGAAFAAIGLDLLPVAVAICGFLLSVDLLSKERNEGSQEVLLLAPISNSGIVLRRYVATLALLIPLFFVPVGLTMLLAIFFGDKPLSVGLFLWPFVLQSIPICLVFTALGAALGAITGSLAGSVFTFFLLCLAVYQFLNDLLARFHLTVGGLGRFVGANGLKLTSLAVEEYSRWILRSISSAPYDPFEAMEGLAGAALPPMVLAALMLGLAVLYLGRSHRDIRPWRIRKEGQLASLVRRANSVRIRLRPDAGLGLHDGLVLLGFLALASVLAGSYLHRWRSFYRLGEARYTALCQEETKPIGAGFRCKQVTVKGRFQTSGEARLLVSEQFVNESGTPQTHLAFELNHGFRSVSLTCNGAPLQISRLFDRIEVTCRAVMPGDSVTLDWTLSGRPNRITFNLSRGLSFHSAWKILRASSVAVEVPPLAECLRAPAFARRSIHLRSTDLMPVPRYDPFALVDTGSGGGPDGKVPMLAESRVRGTIQLDLSLPSRAVLADACGNVQEGTSFHGVCRMPLRDFEIRGGPLVQIPSNAVRMAAVLPFHRQVAPEVVETAATLVRGAFSELDPLHDLVLTEEPGPQQTVGDGLIPEEQGQSALASPSAVLPFPEEDLHDIGVNTGSLLALRGGVRGLVHLRPVAVRERSFFETFYWSLLLIRISGSNSRLATQTLRIKGIPLGMTSTDWRVRNQKLPAILVDLIHRTSIDQVLEGVRRFVRVEGKPMGTAQELFEAIGATSGVPLERFYQDFIAGEKRPVLKLADVVFEHVDKSYRVSGVVCNVGTGESVVDVAFKTEGASPSVRLTVKEGGRTPFQMESRSLPHSVIVDPGEKSYRFVMPGLPLSAKAP